MVDLLGFRRRRLTLVCGLLAASTALAVEAAHAPPARDRITVDDPSWHLESSSDGISLYSGSVPEARVVPLKAVMTIPGTIEEIALVLEDISRRGDWVSNFGESVLLERANDYDQTEYLRVNLPWPARDRTAVIRARVTVSDDDKRATIAAESVESRLADRWPTLVRAEVHASTFQMTQENGQVEVVALVFIDPRGRIPSWIVNYFTRRGARVTLAALRRQVARRLYSSSQLLTMHRRILGFRAFRDQHSTGG
jgi:START domain-containing protein